MKLYHHPFSSNARKVVMTAELLGSDVELVFVDLMKGASRTPDFLAMNPNGKVPVLEDEGFVLWESHAIMQYLADKKPGNALYPTELRARADVNRWLFWQSHHMSPPVATLNFENMLKKMMALGEPDPSQVKRGEAGFTDCAKILDAHLARHPYMAGASLTLADVAIAAPLMYVTMAKLPFAGYEHLTRWFAKVQELDAWKKTNPPR